MNAFMALAVTVAYFVKGLCGFANTLVFTTLMSFQMNNVSLSPIDLLTGFPANLLLAWRERKNAKPRVWGPLSIVVLLGVIPGAIFLKTGNAQSIKLLFGGVVVAIGLENLLRKRVEQKALPKWVFLSIGLISGVLSGLYGVGALLAACVNRAADNASEFRANLCIIFSIENVFRIFLYSALGMITGPVLVTALALTPFMLFGLFMGMRIAGRVTEQNARRIVNIALILSGTALVAGNLFK